ncbi:GntR family transcriptional regulator [Frondihabitans sp. PhB188]|uniref:GntR family transcriptional regulator n=1 Tax=Frondihabitans sp. PhB188 TaxID=2485200 RepID=UPI000F46BD61|nr:GntR family transcriptional regulator [Frondihabitans sp. PhB188]ROQ39954.1 GntR family transcriptional regulator [Frondihabitans sp. PhB188]
MPIPETQRSSPRTLMRDRIREEILKAILSGILEPGERLADDDLISWLGCSRTPVREALSDLAHAGFVEIVPNKHTRVAVPRAEEAVQVIQTLGVLFGGAVRLATPVLPDPVRRQIVATLDTCLADLQNDDGLALNVHTYAAFDLFVDYCGNPHLQRVCHDTTAGLAYKLRLPNITEIFGQPRLTRSYSALRQATLDCDAIAAELAAETLHQLPAPCSESLLDAHTT